jgi:1,2-diacylglycerol 3-alpha-glucosyltransferase
LRIGFFTDSYLPATHGVEVSIETFRKNLEKAGHKVFVYAPAVPDYVDKNRRVFRFKSMRVIETPEMRLAFPLAENGNIRALTRVVLDIVHVHTPFSLGLLGRYISTHQDIPMVYTHHTDYPEYAKAYLKERVLLPFLARRLSAWFSNTSDAVIAPSPKIKTLLRRYGVRKPIYVLPTGIKLDQFRRTAKSAARARVLRARLGLTPGARVLLFVGRLGTEKNVGFLLQSFAKLRERQHDVYFVIVGDGPIRARLQSLTKRLSLDGAVIFAGEVAHKNIASYYRAADLFVFSSLTDTQGLVVLEAVGSGLPVVALRDQAFTSMVRNGQNGVLLRPTVSANEFARRTAALLQDKERQRRFSRASRRIAGRFSEEQEAQKLTQIYEVLVSRSAGRRTPVRIRAERPCAQRHDRN